jgi:hypothetical protein
MSLEYRNNHRLHHRNRCWLFLLFLLFLCRHLPNLPRHLHLNHLSHQAWDWHMRLQKKNRSNRRHHRRMLWLRP